MCKHNSGSFHGGLCARPFLGQSSNFLPAPHHRLSSSSSHPKQKLQFSLLCLLMNAFKCFFFFVIPSVLSLNCLSVTSHLTSHVWNWKVVWQASLKWKCTVISHITTVFIFPLIHKLINGVNYSSSNNPGLMCIGLQSYWCYYLIINKLGLYRCNWILSAALFTALK